MDKKYILFDLDGTITDSGEGIKNSIKYSLNKIGKEENRQEVLNSFIGPPLSDSYIKYYGVSKNEADELIKFYREYYTTKGIYENFLYDDIKIVIEKLKESGNIIILATSKPELFAKKVIEYHNLTKYFDFIAGATLDGKIGHKDEVIQFIIDNYKIDKENAYMIGDTKYDILAGNKLGLNTIGVTYGYGSLEDLKEAKANYIVNSPKEILDIIN